MSLRNRLKRLEKQPHSGRCPECGMLPDGPTSFVVVEEKSDGPERCPRCGRILRFTLDIGEAGVVEHGKR